MFRRALAGLTALTLVGLAAPVAAAPVNLLVMGEDADPDTIERHTTVFDRVRDAIADEMRGGDVAVYDETAVTMEFYDQGRVRRPDAELISLARSVQIVPIDAVTSFQIHAAAAPTAYEGISDLRLRISGRVIGVADGQVLGGYEVRFAPGELPMLPLQCDRRCLFDFVGDQAVPIAREVGAALSAQLADLMVDPDASAAPTDPSAPAGCAAARGFTLAFKGFSAEDLARFDLFLAAFQGYARHHPLEDGEVTEVWYETCAAPDRLERNLRAMFEQTGAEVWLEADEDGFAAARLGDVN